MKLVSESYTASWGTPLKIVTTICVLILIGFPVVKIVASGLLTKLDFALLLKTLLPSCLLVLIVALFLVIKIDCVALALILLNGFVSLTIAK